MESIMIGSIKDEVLKIVAKVLDISPDDIQIDTSIPEHLGADSLDMINIVFAIEEKFKLLIDDETMRSFETVDGIIVNLKRMTGG